MRQFVAVDGLAQLEKEGNWARCVSLLQEKWEKDPQDKGAALRLMSECWYILLNLDFTIDAEKVDDEKIRALLLKVTKYAIAHMRDDYDMLYLCGYMISLLTQVYCEEDTDEEFKSWEKTGLAMLERAYLKNPEDPRAAAFYFGALPWQTKRYEENCERLSIIAKDLFGGDSAVEAYFLDILKKDDSFEEASPSMS